MRKIKHHQIKNILSLSTLLDQVLQTLATTELRVTLKHIAYDTPISEPSFEILRSLNENPDLVDEFKTSDFYAVLSSVLFRYPTLKIWVDEKADLRMQGIEFFLEI
jgi:hypothetical protein